MWWWLIPAAVGVLALVGAAQDKKPKICKQCGEQADFGPLCIAHLAELFPWVEGQFIAGKFLCFKHVNRRPFGRSNSAPKSVDGWYGHNGAFYRLHYPTICSGGSNFFLSPIGGFVESRLWKFPKPEDQAILACLINDGEWQFDDRYIITARNPEVTPVLAMSIAQWIDRVPLKKDELGKWQPDYEHPRFSGIEQELVSQAIRAANWYIDEIWCRLQERVQCL